MRVTDDAVVRIIVSAGRDAVAAEDGEDGEVAAASTAPVIDAASSRIVAVALTGGTVAPRALDAACDAFAEDPHGVDRFTAMARRALRVDQDSATDASLERATAIAAVHAALLRSITQRARTSALAYEQFAAATSDLAAAEGYDDVCRRAADAVRQISGMDAAAVYVPGSEYARMVIGARDGASTIIDGDGDVDLSHLDRRIELPNALRVDRGRFADVLAGERPVVVVQGDPIDALAANDEVRTLIAVPMRDALGRPVGLLLAADRQQRDVDVLAVEGLRRLGSTIAGDLASARAARRSRAALATLPDLASIAHNSIAQVTDQLDQLVAVVIRATESDSAVLRVCDAAGRYMETRSAVSLHGDAVADIIGTRTPVDGDPVEVGAVEADLLGLEGGPEHWSPAGQRILDELSARSVCVAPIPSRFGRRAVLYVVRATSRSFDEVDHACIRIVTAHAQTVVDRHVSHQQTLRATDAARSAVRLLGEAMVAGVRTERTLRFVPRLFHEMFASQGVRVWRRDRAGVLTLVAGTGRMESHGAGDILLEAFERPLQLELDTHSDPNIAAVAFDEYGGSRIGVEFQLDPDRSLGVEEQRLAVDVASRIAEAMWSAGQASAHEQQLDRVRALQDVIASAHEHLNEQQVVSTILEQLPARYAADGASVFLVGDEGGLECRGAVDMPESVIVAIESARTWVTEAMGDERSAVLTMARAGADDRLGESLHGAITDEGMDDHAVVLVPLTGREQTLGLLLMTFRSGLPEEFADDAASAQGGVLSAFGKHVGTALVNARTLEHERIMRGRSEQLLDTERENSRQVRALHEVSRTFATSLSFDETMRAVVEAMADRLDIDAVWIRTRDERGDMMELRAFHATHPELADALERMVAPPEPREDPLTQEVVTSRRAVLIDDPAADLWAQSMTLQRLRPFLQRGSTLAVLPIVRPGSAAEDVMGTLMLLSIDPEHALTHDKVDIAASVAGQAALALDNARLYEQQKSFAEIIQESLLPRRLPDVPGIDYGVLYRSAVVGGDAPQIGGDFYDFLELEDGRLAMALGDVTGKGVQAAADTTMTKYVFRSLAREHPAPANFLRYANEVVCDEITSGKFVTLFYAVIDPVNETFVCGNAGHPEPKLVLPDREHPENDPEIRSLSSEGLALGILTDQDYEQKTFPFPPGATLVVYTDGVVEARREGRLYGQFRLERRIMEEAGGGAGQIAYSIYEDCHAYAEHGLNDDVAIVVVRHLPEADR